MKTEVRQSLRDAVKNAIFIAKKSNRMIDVSFKSSSVKVFPGELEESILEQLSLGANFQFFNGNNTNYDLLDFIQNVVRKTNQYKIPSMVIWADSTEFSVLPGDTIDFVINYQITDEDIEKWEKRDQFGH